MLVFPGNRIFFVVSIISKRQFLFPDAKCIRLHIGGVTCIWFLKCYHHLNLNVMSQFPLYYVKDMPTFVYNAMIYSYVSHFKGVNPEASDGFNCILKLL